MKGNMKSWIAMLMGVIILIADLIWTYQSAYDVFWLVLGIVILIADVVWLYIDYSFMKR